MGTLISCCSFALPAGEFFTQPLINNFALETCPWVCLQCPLLSFWCPPRPEQPPNKRAILIYHSAGILSCNDNCPNQKWFGGHLSSHLGCSHGIDFCHPVSFQLYQIYAKKPASEVHEILVRYNTSYIILEDSICLAPTSRCNLGSNMDLANGHVSSLINFVLGERLVGNFSSIA